MKRSEINAIMRDSLAFLELMRFRLPPFAYWTPEDWGARGAECREIVDQQLGWDITDFGTGDFTRVGLFLFTIRNGNLAALAADPHQKSYCEKVLITHPDQLTPKHCHDQKMEDIINRGGGTLLIRFWYADKNLRLASGPVDLSFDGVRRRVAAGEKVALGPGESVTIPRRVYHEFWAEREPTLIGEVSKVNDDHTDNLFLEPAGRFPEIEENEEPLHLLVGDYPRYYAHARGE